MPSGHASHAQDPHAGQPVLRAGPEPEEARGGIVLVHGRGAPAESMLAFYDALNITRLAAFAPQAAGATWYPHSFLVPLENNQPYLDSALGLLDSLVSELNARGLASNHIALLGFSQGACLALEFAARHPRRYGAVIGLSGGLIGPPGMPRKAEGSLAGTPVFLGASDPDPHVPFERVIETEWFLKQMGAETELRRYPGMAHTINEDELAAARKILQKME